MVALDRSLSSCTDLYMKGSVSGFTKPSYFRGSEASGLGAQRLRFVSVIYFRGGE